MELHLMGASPSGKKGSLTSVTKENPGCWTRRRAFAPVRHGSNIQLLPYSLVTRHATYALGGSRLSHKFKTRPAIAPETPAGRHHRCTGRCRPRRLARRAEDFVGLWRRTPRRETRTAVIRSQG